MGVTGTETKHDSALLTRFADPLIACCVLVAVALTGWLASFAGPVAAGGAPEFVWDWVPNLGIAFAVRLDGLSFLFSLLICGIGVLVLAYAAAYAATMDKARRLVGLLAAFMLAMLGLVVADDLILLFIFWELTTIISYLLIGFDHESAKARKAALQGLLVTAAGGLILLAGLVVLGQAAGTYRLSGVIEAIPTLPDGTATTALVLLLFGAFTKSAQVPFHFWLPNAMAAPTPASAYLHSATMVKAGVFLLMRFHPAYSDHELWFPVLTIVGAITAVWASIAALRQDDLKQMLAHTTVMGLGSLTMFLGGSAPEAVAAAVTFLLVHALYKCALFLVIGVIDHGTGTRQWQVLGGLRTALPITTVAAATAALSMAGFPPFLGFIGKELKYEGALAIAGEPYLIVVAAVAANAMMVAVAAVIALKPFYGARTPATIDAHGSTWPMWSAPLVLGVLGLLFGLAPDHLGDWLVVPAIESTLGGQTDMYLALWHGVNVPLMLSIVTAGLGIAIFWQFTAVRAGLARVFARLPRTASDVYDAIVDATLALGVWQTRRLQTGRLVNYTLATGFVLVLVLGWALVRHGWPGIPNGWSGVRPWELVAVGLIVAGAATALTGRSRLPALVGLGAVGLGIALVFLQFGAVDVAITQFMVETLIVLLVAAVVPRLPRLNAVPAQSRLRQWSRTAVSAGVGLGAFAVLLALVAIPVDRSLTAYFEAESVPTGHGRNIVNVILVDFRALDTLGEIVVVVLAAVGAWAVLRWPGRRRRRAEATQEG